MITILKTKFLLLARKPASFIIITVIICLFSYVLGLGQHGKMPIGIYSDLDSEKNELILRELGKLQDIEFTLYEEQEAIEKVEKGNVEAVIHFKEDRFELIVGPDFLDAPLLQNQVSMIYSELTQKQQILKSFEIGQEQGEVSSILNTAKENPSFNIQYANFSTGESFIWDSKLHSLFGFSLFMVIYTIANGVHYMVIERRNLIWDRLKISSVGKLEAYLANLVYIFLLGYLQVLIVLAVFYYGVGVDFYGGFYWSLLAVIPYLLCIIALSTFLASISTSPGKFNAYVAVMAVPFAMLGGAFWPLEIVTSKVILALSYISPITYGLDLLNGVTIDGNTLSQLVQPIFILLMMSIIFMGIAINRMEKKED